MSRQWLRLQAVVGYRITECKLEIAILCATPENIQGHVTPGIVLAVESAPGDVFTSGAVNMTCR